MFGELQHARWSQRILQFFTECAAGQKPKVLHLQQTGLANKHVFMGLDHTLQMGAELSLLDFQVPADTPVLFQNHVKLFSAAMNTLPHDVVQVSPGRSRRICSYDSKTGETSLAVIWSSPRRILQAHIDQGSIGVPAKVAMFCHYRMRGWLWIDHSHRRNNCLNDAFSAAGLACARQEMAFLTSVGCGPWGAAGNFGSYSGAIHEFCTNRTVNDSLFQNLYGYITHYMNAGCIPTAYGDYPHMGIVWDWVKTARVVEDPGVKVKLGRWCAPTRKWRDFAKQRGVLFLALIYSGITLKWWKTCEDSPLATLNGGSAHQHDGDDGDGPDDPAADGPDAPDAGPGDDPGVVVAADIGRSVVRSSLGIERKASSAKAQRLAAEILGKLSTMSLLDWGSAVAEPVEKELFRTNTKHKSSDDTLEWYIQMACGQRLMHLGHVLALGSNRELLMHTLMINGHNRCLPTHQGRALFELADASISLIRHVVAKELAYCSMFSGWLPYRLAGTLSTAAELRDASLDWCRRAWETVRQAEAAGLRAFVGDLLWPLAPWPREMCIGLWENDFKSPLPPDVLQELTDAFRKHGTVTIEDMFNHMRKLIRTNQQGSMGAASMWHKSINSSLLADSDQTLVTSQAEDKRAADFLPKQMFTAIANDNSLGHATVDNFCQATSGISLSATSYMQLPCLQSALMSTSTEDLPRVWLSQLVIPGHLIYREGSCDRWWVLSVCSSGVLVWRLRRLRADRDDQWTWQVSASNDNWAYLHIFDYEAWYTQPLGSNPPCELANPPTLFLDTMDQDPLPILSAAAKSGFKSWTCARMKQLITELRILEHGEKMPSLELELARLLISRTLPQASSAEVEQILAGRDKKKQKMTRQQRFAHP